ncbi:MAG: hypothetical protein Q6363_010185 [Candidatus Njordarchaeota archaeon]
MRWVVTVHKKEQIIEIKEIEDLLEGIYISQENIGDLYKDTKPVGYISNIKILPFERDYENHIRFDFNLVAPKYGVYKRSISVVIDVLLDKILFDPHGITVSFVKKLKNDKKEVRIFSLESDIASINLDVISYKDGVISLVFYDKY